MFPSPCVHATKLSEARWQWAAGWLWPPRLGCLPQLNEPLPPRGISPVLPLGNCPIGDRHLLQMAPQMDRLPALGEARCEISRGEQAKGGGAVLERLGGILLSSPPCRSSNLVCAPGAWARLTGLIQTGCRGRKSRRVEAGPGGLPSAFAPGCGGRPTRPRDATREKLHCTQVLSWPFFKRSPPASLAHKQGAPEVSLTNGLCFVGQRPIGISETGKSPPTL